MEISKHKCFYNYLYGYIHSNKKVSQKKNTELTCIKSIFSLQEQSIHKQEAEVDALGDWQS